MASARGICPVCGEERAVRHGGMNDHTDQRTKANNRYGFASACLGVGQPPTRVTKTAEAASAETKAKKAEKEKKAKAEKAEREKKEREKIEKKAAAFKDIPAETKEALSKAIMQFEQPGICPEGRRKFLKEHGFPVPPQEFTFTLSVRTSVGEEDLSHRSGGRSGFPKDSFVIGLKKKISESLPDDITLTNLTNLDRY